MVRFMVAYVVAVVLVGVAVAWVYYGYFTGGDPVRVSVETGEPGNQAGDERSDQVALLAPPVPQPIPASPSQRSFNPSPKPLALPIDCTPGTDCWIINYVDVDPTEGRQDFACGDMSYDGHKGTDFALASETRLEDNVAVLSLADGRVVGIRDNMQDISIRVGGKEAVQGKECGNGVRIDHGGGWVAQYCHLKRGSVSVEAGDSVRTGQPIGAVGLSGMTEFPHVHVQLTKDDKVVDPFIGISGGPTCGLGDAPLWRPDVLEQLTYASPKLFHIGFLDRQVDFDEIRTGSHTREVIAPNAPVMILFIEMAGVRPGDLVTMSIWGPDGQKIVSSENTYDKTRIVARRIVGSKLKGSWAPGVYRGIVRAFRNGPDGRREFRKEARVLVR